RPVGPFEDRGEQADLAAHGAVATAAGRCGSPARGEGHEARRCGRHGPQDGPVSDGHRRAPLHCGVDRPAGWRSPLQRCTIATMHQTRCTPMPCQRWVNAESTPGQRRRVGTGPALGRHSVRTGSTIDIGRGCATTGCAVSVTIHQVAAEAGVSPSTVSNVLNGRSDRMLPQTRERVEAAIARLGYRPNGPARQLCTARSHVLGRVVPSVANPFWGTFARHREAAALQAGYRVLLCNSERDPGRERGYLEELWADGVRGVVLCSSLPSLEHVLPLVDRGLTLVAFDRTAQAGDPPSLVNISVDNAVGAELATRHLLELGHRRLAFVSGSLRSVNRRARFSGFEAALERFGLTAEDAVVWSGGVGNTDTDDYGDLDFPELGRAAARE